MIAVKSGRTAAGQRAAVLAHGRDGRGVGHDRRRAVRARGRDPHGDDRRDVRRRRRCCRASRCRAGDRVAIVTNAGGPGILCADALRGPGPARRAARRRRRSARCASVLPPRGLGRQPGRHDRLGDAPRTTRASLELVLADPGVDAVISLFVRAARHARRRRRRRDRVGAARAVARATPVLAVFLGADRPAPPPPGEPGVPVFASPEEAARALGARRAPRAAAAPRRRTRRRTLDGLDARPRRRDRVARRSAPAAAGCAPADVEGLLGALGLPLARSRQVATRRRGRRRGRRARRPGGAQGVAPGPAAQDRRRRRAARPRGRGRRRARRGRRSRRRWAPPAIALEGFLVQTMAPEGTELLVGVVGDPAFGPLVAVGAGGTAAELIRDIQVRLAPLGRREAGEMIRALRDVPAARRLPRAPARRRRRASRTWCCACPRSPPRIRRSPSSTATR